MLIWYNDINLELLKSRVTANLARHLDIQFHALGDNFLEIKMPVSEQVKQPYGILHGGASCVLAETVGSVAGNMCIDQEKFVCVGLEINANHLRMARDGILIARAEPMHIGGKTHVWDIKIRDQADDLICVSRLTLMVVARKS